jgi:predicted acyltransferase
MQPENNKRLISLDALRGFDMLWITGGDNLIISMASLTGWPFLRWAENQMRHVPWEGFTFYDMIFPLFLFITGVTLPFSINKRKNSGNSIKSIYLHLFKRLILLIILGLIYNGILRFEFEHQRYASVLGRIGLAWFFAAIIFLNTNIKGQVIWFFSILLAYWALMKLVPVPGYGAGVLSPEGNLAAYIDQLLLPGSFCCYEFGDNEGILSTLPTISTALLGALTGHFLMYESTTLNKFKKGVLMLLAGLIFLGLGKIWGLVFPVIKNLWTSSYVLYAGGWSMLLLAFFYIIIDVWNIRKWSFPFVIIGLNSITIYMLSAGIINFQNMSEFFFAGLINLFNVPYRPVISAVCLILCEWGFLYILYKKRIFLKI